MRWEINTALIGKKNSNGTFANAMEFCEATNIQRTQANTHTVGEQFIAIAIITQKCENRA